MARTSLSLIAAAWLLAASQASAGPIATADEPAAANTELASLGGLLQALGAGVIGNGALLYPTAPASHQRAEAEILASDTATRILKKVKSILKEGGLNEDEDGGDDESKTVTYMVKPAMIFHKEELPPPNPLAGNVLPLPGGALMYTPSPTGAPNGEPTSGPAASIKAAYGNLFAASPYTPSYTLNKPHAAVVVEEITDLLSLKSSLQRMEEAGEDVDDDDSDEEDNYGRKKKPKKAVKMETLEFVESSSTFVNPFTRADFPFGIMTPQPTVAATSSAKKSVSHKTITKTAGPKTTASANSSSDLIRASIGKDGAITVVNNGATPTPTPTPQGTTIVIPAASLQGSSSSASAASSSASAASSSSAAPEGSQSSSASPQSESKNEDTNANEVTRLAHVHKSSSSSSSAKAEAVKTTGVSGVRRDAATSFDPLSASASGSGSAASSSESAAQNSGIEALASDSKDSATPSVTAGSDAPTSDAHAETSTNASAHAVHASSDMPKRRKMRIVKVYEVKKNKHGQSGEESVSIATTKSVELHKRDVLPVYDADDAYTSPIYARETAVAAAADAPYYRNMYPAAAVADPYANNRVGNVQRIYKDRDDMEDNEDESDNEDAESDKPAEGGEDKKSSSHAAEETGAVEETTVVETTVVEHVASEPEANSSSDSASAASSESSASAESSTSASASASASAKEETVSPASSSPSAAVSATATVETSTTEIVKVGKTATPSPKSSVESSSAKSAETSASTSVQKGEPMSMSIETIGTDGQALGTSTTPASSSDTATAASTTVDAKSDVKSDSKSDASTSVDKKDSKSGSDSDKDSDDESDDSDSDDEDASEKDNERDSDDNEENDNSDEESDNDDDEKGSGKKGARAKARVASKSHDIDDKQDSIRALNRLAALGMREAEKAVLDFEMHSEAVSGIEIMTTTDRAVPGAGETEATGTASADSLTDSLASETVSASNHVRAAANKDADDDGDDESDDDDDDDEDAADKKDTKSSGSDSDGDDDGSGSDSDDSDSEKAPRPSANSSSSSSMDMSMSMTGPMSTTASAAATHTANEEDAESMAAHKALAEALAESSKQAIEVSLTELETAEGSSVHASGIARGQEASDELESDLDMVTNASDDEIEFETNASVNSDGEEVEFVTELVPAHTSKNALVNESPSIVVMASIDEEFEEEYFTQSTSPASTTGADAKPEKETSVSAVQRDAADAEDDTHDDADADEKLVRGAEPVPDVNMIKESQNRAMNIGLGNLRRHI